jgi:hypothetical protein
MKSPRPLPPIARARVANHDPQAKNWRNIITDKRVSTAGWAAFSMMDGRLDERPARRQARRTGRTSQIDLFSQERRGLLKFIGVWMKVLPQDLP